MLIDAIRRMRAADRDQLLWEALGLGALCSAILALLSVPTVV